MADSTGRDSQLGFAQESTYGTAVTVDTFFEYNSENIAFDRERIDSASLMAGAKRVRRWVKGREGGTGAVTFELLPNGAPFIFKNLLGAAAVSTPSGATDARLWTCTEDNLDDLSMTMQVGRPDRDGTVQPFTYAGCKVASWELSMEASGLLMLTVNLDVKSETTATALATASYPDENYLLDWADANTFVTLNGTEYDVASITVGDDNGLKTDRYALGSRQKLKQVEGTQNSAGTGTVTLESFAGLTPHALYADGTEFEFVANFAGALIETGHQYEVTVTAPRCRADGTTPNVDGPDMLGQEVPFVVLEPTDGTTSGITVEVVCTDTAL